MLVLSARSTGVAHKILASDMNGGTVLSSLRILRSGDASPDDVDASDNFQYTMQVASDASFTVNSVLVTRSQNTGLANVIGGVSLNLAPDAQGKDATLTVSADWSSARTALDTFISKFNEVQSYLAAKTSVDSTTVNGQTTYTRGALADDNIFSELRGDLFYSYMANDSTGALQSLRDIGITLDDNLQASISDSTKLETALSSNFSNVKILLDQVMNSIDSKLSRFTGTTSETGYIDNALSGITGEAKDVNDEITEMNAYLAEREQYLTDQYAEIQAQLMTLSYSQQMWSSIYGTTSRLV
jgi:flagellar hook-associated protein 2